MAVYALFGILLSIYRYQDLIWETGNRRKGSRRTMAWGVGKYRIRIERRTAETISKTTGLKAVKRRPERRSTAQDA